MHHSLKVFVMGKKFFKGKLFAGLTAAVCAVSVTVGVSYADSVEELNEKRNQAESELSDVESQLSSLLKEMSDIDVRASDIIADIYENDVQLGLEQEKHTQQYHDMRLRIQFMYENRTERIEESLLSSKSMGEFLNSAGYFQNIYSYDRDKLDEIEETEKQIQKIATSLKADLEEVEVARAEMAEKQAEITDIVTQKREEITQIDSEITAAAIAAAEAQEEQRRQEEEQAARLAEIEAEAKRALENNADSQEDDEEEVIVADNRSQRQDTRTPERSREEERANVTAATTQATTVARTTQAATTAAARKPEPEPQPERQTNQNNNYNSGNASSGKAQLVAEYARTNNGTFPCTYGWCAAWVSGIYAKAGVTPPHGNAIDYWNKWSYSGGTGKYNIPVGACVISSGAGFLAETYGHIGIYIGNGLVANNVGYLRIESIDSFDYSATATCQGHTGYIGWVWPNGIPLN